MPRAGREAGPTIVPERSALVVIRNLTSLSRLLDVTTMLEADSRVGVSYVVDEGSAFAAGLGAHLGAIGIHPLTWSGAVGRHFDLVLAAHVNTSLAALDGPLVVIPHGAGYNRLLPARTNDDVSPVGLSRRELTVAGEVFPTVIGLSHSRQLDQLRRTCPEAADRTRVVGDPTWDQIQANRRRRDLFRGALGVLPGQRLVVVSSTWDVNSLLARQRQLINRLVAQLPIDEFRVALVLHPNIWAYHGPVAVRGWLRDALDAGLLLLRPDDGWQAALIASDVGIGDHGSVAFYTAAMGRPFLQAVDGLDDLASDSMLAVMGRTTEKIDTMGDLRAQIESVSVRHHPAGFDHIAGQMLSHQGEASQVLRQIFYELMALRAPDRPPRVAPIVAPIPITGNDITAFHTTVVVDDWKLVTVERFPAVVGAHGHHNWEPTPLLVIKDTEIDNAMWAAADVVVRRTPPSDGDARGWIGDTLANSRADVVVVGGSDSYILGLRDGRVLAATGGPASILDPIAVGSAVHRWATGTAESELRFKLRMGPARGTSVPVTIRPVGSLSL